jgi:hypothetical protein
MLFYNNVAQLRQFRGAWTRSVAREQRGGGPFAWGCSSEFSWTPSPGLDRVLCMGLFRRILREPFPRLGRMLCGGLFLDFCASPSPASTEAPGRGREHAHGAQQRRDLPSPGDRLGAVAPVLERMPVALRRARRQSAVHPASAVRHCRRPTHVTAPCAGSAARAQQHGQSALHGIVPRILYEPSPAHDQAPLHGGSSGFSYAPSPTARPHALHGVGDRACGHIPAPFSHPFSRGALEKDSYPHTRARPGEGWCMRRRMCTAALALL